MVSCVLEHCILAWYLSLCETVFRSSHFLHAQCHAAKGVSFASPSFSFTGPLLPCYDATHFRHELALYEDSTAFPRSLLDGDRRAPEGRYVDGVPSTAL
mmetsp:Transcript_10496/g.64281  ORF Transcript_10496/g.64281 Transcript_10496/m.64281 type:complete len:99 (+) Transcript_10496:2640-2936(+)